MSPTPENPQALADTAAYAQELKQRGIEDVVVDIAGYGFIRGRMITPERLETTARSIFIMIRGNKTEWDGEMLPEHRRRYWRRIAWTVLRAAGLTVLDPPP